MRAAILLHTCPTLKVTHLPPKTREAPPGPLGPSVVACMSTPKTMNNFHLREMGLGSCKKKSLLIQFYTTKRTHYFRIEDTVILKDSISRNQKFIHPQARLHNNYFNYP